MPGESPTTLAIPPPTDFEILLDHARALKPDRDIEFTFGEDPRLNDLEDKEKEGCYTASYQELIQRLNFPPNMGRKMEQDLSFPEERDRGKAFIHVTTPSGGCLRPLRPLLTSLLHQFQYSSDTTLNGSCLVSEDPSEEIPAHAKKAIVDAIQMELFVVLFTRASMRMTEEQRARLAQYQVSDCALTSTVSDGFYRQIKMSERLSTVTHQLARKGWAGFKLEDDYLSTLDDPANQASGSGTLRRSTHSWTVHGEMKTETYWYDGNGKKVA